jgi:hypothetical protein
MMHPAIFEPRHGEGLVQTALEFEAYRARNKIPAPKKKDYAPTPFNVITDGHKLDWFDYGG